MPTGSQRSRARVVGVFGGTFDPPHLGHALLPLYLRSRGLVDHLVVAPTADHPFGAFAAVSGNAARSSGRGLGSGSASGSTKAPSEFDQRMSWTRAAMEPHGAFVEVTDLEARLHSEHGGPSYTLRLLEAVQERHRGDAVRLVIGSDIVQRQETRRWHRWDEIEERFDPLVVPRVGYADPDACALPEVSSTTVRAALRAGRFDALRTLVPAAVLAQLRRPSQGTIWLVGRGHVGAHAEPWLRARGWAVRTLSGRHVRSACEALRSDQGSDEAPWPTAVWLLVPDPAVPSVAQALADPELGLPTQCIVLHACGARIAADVLRPLAPRPRATLHPICSLRAERAWPSWLPLSGFGVEGDAPARALALDLVGSQPWVDLQGLDASSRRAYHAACSLTANHLAVLWETSTKVLADQGHDPKTVRDILALLLRSSMDNLLSLGIPRGVTGPVARGDMQTVRAHVASLSAQAAELYRMLSDRLAVIVSGAPGEDP